MYDILTNKYTATWGGILRIILWVVFFLWLAGLAIPRNLQENVAYMKSVKSKDVTSMMTVYMDKRIVREDVAFNPHELNIAWLCDSACLLTPPGKTVVAEDDDYYTIVPEEVLKSLQKRFPGRKMHLYLYDVLGPYPPDNQALVPKVIASHPDIIIYSTNTVRAYDVFSFFAHDQSKPALSKIWMGEPELRLLPFIRISPAANLYAVVGDYFRSIREMTAFKASFCMGFLSDAAKEVKARKESLSPNSKSPSERRFWIVYLSSISQAAKTSEMKFRTAIPGLPDPETYVYTVFEDAIGTLATSGIPTLVYPMALAPRFQADISVRRSLDAYEREMRLLKERYKNEQGFFIIDRIPDTVVNKIIFKPGDVMHQENADAFISYMTDEAVKMIKVHDDKKEVKHEELPH